MMGIYVVVGAAVLGALSCVLIGWSLWSRSQARKRARQRQLVSGQYAALPGQYGGQHGGQYAQQGVAYPPAGHTVVAGPADGFEHEPRTQLMSSGQLFGQVDAPDEPTQFLSEADLLGAGGGAEDEDEHEVATAFMSDAELFGEHEDEDDDDDEVATAFMTTHELFGASAPSGAAVAPPVDPTVVLAGASLDPAPVYQPPAQPPARAPQVSARAPARAPQPFARPTPGVRRRAAPPTGSHVAFVGDRSNDPDDDDDDFDDDDDPETELVHQAELLRLISTSKPGSK